MGGNNPKIIPGWIGVARPDWIQRTGGETKLDWGDGARLDWSVPPHEFINLGVAFLVTWGWGGIYLRIPAYWSYRS